MKTCSKCKTPKPETDFSPDKSNKDGRAYWCKGCCNRRRRETRKLAPNKLREQNTILSKKYNTSTDEQEKRLQKQKNRCAICKTKKPGGRYNVWQTDHPHKGPKRVRGLLCYSCNTGLGHFKDDPKILKAAIVYLRGKQ